MNAAFLDDRLRGEAKPTRAGERGQSFTRNHFQGLAGEGRPGRLARELLFEIKGFLEML